MRSYLTSLGSLAAVGSLVAGFSCSAHDTVKTSPSPVSYAGTNEAELVAARATLAKTPLGKVVAKDASGTARYVMASPAANAARVNLQPEAATRLHLERHARMLGLSEAAVRSAVLKETHTMSTGASVAQFEQRVDGIEVFRGRASVLVDASNQLVSISNSMVGGGAPQKVKGNAFPLAAEAALATAYSSHAGVGITADDVRDQGESGPARSYAVNSPAGAMHVVSATAKKVFYPVNGVLEGAYYVEILGNAHGSRENDARAYVIAATDGRILHDQSLTMHDSFNYRVWAEKSGLHTPLDGPIADTTPHPTGQVDGFKPAFVEPELIAMEGFNKNPDGKADPWLKPTDTYTFGNNVQAYSDRNGGGDGGIISTTNGWQDNTSDLRAEITSPLTFDRKYDLTKPPNDSPDQIKAAVTQLFYTNNWLHDFWYDSGFNEAANNAQTSNYMRGGAERDPLLAEAQDAADSGQSNNANMSPLADGTSPRMQMYVWTGLGNRKLTTNPPITISDSIGASGYGPQVFDLPATAVILANDNSTAVMAGTTGVGTFTDACQALPADVMGKIVVAERGGCNFTTKSVNAQAKGAVGIILLNNAPGNSAPSPGGADPSITIPLLGLSQEDGAKLKAAMMAGTVTATLTRGAETMRDGTIDNTIVAHEWGHYFHHRLVQCSSASCNGMSEGWGDFVALMMSIREGDTFDDKIYALSQYSTAGFSRDGAYFGIRRAPYSKSKTKNPFTFGHIKQSSTLPTTAPLAPAGADMSEVHNVGEIWAQALFEAYANLIEANRAAGIPFAETQRHMADYIVAGMKTAPVEPTFVEQRDAILAASYASKRVDDFMAMAKGFADRGFGISAVAPPTTSTNLNETMEAFDFKGKLAFVNAKVDDSASSCDKDGNLDANESGKLTIEVRNSGWNKLTKTQVKATTTNPDITFADGGMTQAVSLDPFGTATLTLGVTAKAGATKRDLVPITFTLTDSDAVNPSSEAKFQALFNFDELKATSTTDDVEGFSTVWTQLHNPKPVADAWTRTGDAANHLWHGDNMVVLGDESLVSPDLIVGSTDAFTLSFRHRYSFELAALIPGLPGTSAVDGGVIEISIDGGEWQDITTQAMGFTYPSTIVTNVLGQANTNPLAGRRAFTGASTGFAQNTFANVKIDLGNKVAGKTVKVRFRIGTDDGVGAPGWDIDDIAFTGITNKPFGSIADQDCKADAGTGGPGDAGGGTGGAGGSGAGGSTPGSDDGCSCSVPGGTRSNGAAAMGVLGALAAMFARRRSRKQS